MSPEAVPLMAYGIYLMNGGKKEDFMDLSIDDIQVIFTTFSATQAAQTASFAEVISKMFGGK